MTISPAQLALRTKHLGASDIPAILGLDPYTSPADVWLYKTQQIADPRDSSEAIELGNDFEPVGVKRLSDRTGRMAIPHPSTARAGNGVMIAHADCILVDTLEWIKIPDRQLDWPVEKLIAAGGLPGEIKWRGESDDWGENGSDQVPVGVAAQVYAQAICLCVSTVYVGAFFPRYRGVEFRTYEVKIRPELAREIEDKACLWWIQHVEKGIQPTGRAPSLELTKRIMRRPGTVVELDSRMVLAVETARILKRKAEKQAEEAEATLRAAMAGADGSCPGFDILLSEVERQPYSVPFSRYTTVRIKPKKEIES